MGDVTTTLSLAAGGDLKARGVLADELYAQLRALARRKMASERAGHTLSATALVHEAFMTLIDQDRAAITDRAHFLAIASLAMRRVLISHARKKGSAKRGAGERAITLDDNASQRGLPIDDIVALDTALDKLASLSERQALVVGYRAFGAMTDKEIAQVLEVSVPTVRRDYRMGAAWLQRELTA